MIQNPPSLSPEQFGKMLDTLTHRGPDGRGVKIIENGTVMLGHRRLAIIDLGPAAAQPICNEDGSIWLTFNGEIYNYRLLRRELLTLGHRFRSASDSEVIVHAFEEWGLECVQRLRGIFAFGLWDGRSGELLLARDPLGVKPLYYAQYRGRFTFASQPKAILADPDFPRAADPTALRDFFAFGYVPYDRAAFASMAKLPAGHLARLRGNSIELHRYWRLKCSQGSVAHDEALHLVRDGLLRAVRSQLVSDVPVGCFLSGGIDSSLLVALAHDRLPENLRTFTIGFVESESDERRYARYVANHFGTTHIEDVLERHKLEQRLENLQEYFDEPFDPNGPLPFMEIARLAREHDTVVALGGDGADEIFAGYLRYDDFDRPMGLSGRQLQSWWRRLRRLGVIGARSARNDDPKRYFGYEGCLPDHAQHRLFTSTFFDQVEGDASDLLKRFYPKDVPAVTAAQYLDTHLYLVDHILCKVDRASMAYGVEVRVPFLDPDLVQNAFNIPVGLIYRNGERKNLLKEVATQFLPTEVVNSRKKGFSSPIGPWTNRAWTEWANGLLDDGLLMQLGILRADWEVGLSELRATYGVRPHWLLLVAELWARRWLC